MHRGLRTLLLILLVVPALTGTQIRRSSDESAVVHRAPTRTYDVQNYVIRLTLDYPRKSMSGDVTVVLNPLKDGLDEVVLDSAELHIQKVEFNGASLSYHLEGDKLEIELGRPYKATETIALRIFYDGQPRRGLYFVGGDPAYPNTPKQIWSQGEDQDSHYWFPSFDFPSDKAASETYITVAKPFSVVSNGQLLGVVDNGPARTFHWKMDVPHSTYLTSIAVGDFEEYKSKVGDVSVEYYVPKGTGRQKTLRSFGVTPDILQYFSQKIGIPYPYTKYAQVAAADFLFGGMENISATTQNASTLHDERADIDSKSDRLVAHELSHQWWGDLVTPADWSHVWLSEGFATFFEDLYTRKSLGEDEYRFVLYQNAAIYFNEDQEYRRPVVSGLYTDPSDLFDAHCYDKGGLILAMLDDTLGDAAFFKALNLYGTRFARKNATTDDFRRAVEDSTGKNFGRFFDQWLYHGGFPDYQVTWTWDSGVASVNVRQRQKVDDVTPLFDIPVVIDFTFADKQVKKFTVEIDKTDQTFTFPLASRPVMVRFDPGNTVLKKIDFRKDFDELLFQARNDSDVIGRIRAIDDLTRNLPINRDSRLVPVLAEILGSNAFAGVRMSAATGLGKTRGERALTELIQAATDKDWRVRRAAVLALAEFQGDERANHAVVTALQKDASYNVEAAAATALGRMRSSSAFDVLTAALNRESQDDVVRQSALLALLYAGPRDKVRPIILKFTEYGHDPATRTMAVALLPRLADADPSGITRRLLDLLKDPWIFTRESAIVALGQLRAPDALAPLERSAQTESDGRLRREAREAITEIRSSDK